MYTTTFHSNILSFTVITIFYLISHHSSLLNSGQVCRKRLKYDVQTACHSILPPDYTTLPSRLCCYFEISKMKMYTELSFRRSRAENQSSWCLAQELSLSSSSPSVQTHSRGSLLCSRCESSPTTSLE